MKINNEAGSKKRLFEMMGNVNKVTLEEEFGLPPENPSNNIVSTIIEQIKDDIIKITNSDSMQKGAETFVDLIGKDDKNNIVKMNIATEPKQGEMDGVFSLNKAELRGFAYQKSDGSEEIVLDGSGLRQANENHKDDLIEIVSRYADIESEGDEEINDELYEDAVNWIDNVPYKGGSQRMQTQKAYGDEKPTNSDVRVHSPELNQFVSERSAEPIDIDSLAGEDLLKAKIGALTADLEFTKLAQAYENFLKIKKIDFEPSDILQKALSATRDLIAEYLQQAKGLDISGEDVQNFFNSTLGNKRSVVAEDMGGMGGNQEMVLSREVILRAFYALLAEKGGQQPSREEVRDRANIMMRERQLAATRMNEDDKKSDYPDPIGSKFKPKSNYPKKKKKPQTTVKVGEGVEKEVDVEVGSEPEEAPDVVNFDAEIGDEPNGGLQIEPDFQAMGLEPEANDDGPDTGQAPDFKDMPSPTEMPDDIEQLMQDKEEAGDMIPGGLADDKTPQEFCPHQLKKGLEVEMEHTDDPLIAIEITMDHLVENPKYYGDDDENPDKMAQSNAEKDSEKKEKEDDEVADELLGFKPHNIGDIPEVPEDEEDKEETDVLLGFKPQNVGDYEGGEEDVPRHAMGAVLPDEEEEVDEIQMVGDTSEAGTKGTERYQGSAGDKYQDGEGNRFTVTNITDTGVGLRGDAGDKEIATRDLQFMKKLSEGVEEKVILTEELIKTARKALNNRGVGDGMTKKEAVQILIKHNIK